MFHRMVNYSRKYNGRLAKCNGQDFVLLTIQRTYKKHNNKLHNFLDVSTLTNPKTRSLVRKSKSVTCCRAIAISKERHLVEYEHNKCDMYDDTTDDMTSLSLKPNTENTP